MNALYCVTMLLFKIYISAIDILSLHFYFDVLYTLFHRLTSYIDPMKAWYDLKTKQELVNRKLFQKLQVLHL